MAIAGLSIGFGMPVFAHNWAGVSDKRKRVIDRKTGRMAKRIRRRFGHVKPSLKTRLYFRFVRMLQKKGLSEADRSYWTEMG